MTFKKLIESPVGKVGRTGAVDAEAHISPELKKKFIKIVKELGGKTVARSLINSMNINLIKDVSTDKTDKGTTNENTGNIEDILIKNNIKIKKKFSTKFGTEFILFKDPDEDNINKILKNYRVTYDGKSIFVS